MVVGIIGAVIPSALWLFLILPYTLNTKRIEPSRTLGEAGFFNLIIFPLCTIPIAIIGFMIGSHIGDWLESSIEERNKERKVE
ncbi:MAG: hypothetical protein JSS65_03400 [Armatimonadetes bacterium]|nr:hypothetical protein [Armatimonadota bacterium]